MSNLALSTPVFWKQVSSLIGRNIIASKPGMVHGDVVNKGAWKPGRRRGAGGSAQLLPERFHDVFLDGGKFRPERSPMIARARDVDGDGFDDAPGSPGHDVDRVGQQDGLVDVMGEDKCYVGIRHTRRSEPCQSRRGPLPGSLSIFMAQQLGPLSERQVLIR